MAQYISRCLSRCYNRAALTGERMNLLADKIRLGIVGAGSFTRGRTLPNFRKLSDEVEIVAVANRSVASASAIARDFEIPEALDDWRRLVERDDLDAVFIGAPPYIHLDVASAAMEAGKDVLSQTRMSRTLDEARQMVAKEKETGRKGALVRPSRFVPGDVTSSTSSIAATSATCGRRGTTA